MRHLLRWGSATLALVVLLLAGCSAGQEVSPRLLSADAVKALSCTDAKSVQATIDEANRAPENSGKRRSLSNWIPGDRTVTQVQADLDAHVNACASPSAPATETASPDASPSASATAAPSSSASASATPTTTMIPADYVGWDHIVASPPEGLQAAIERKSTQLGFGWADVEKWASVKVGDNLADARVVLAFEDYLSATAARKAAGVDAAVSVVRVSGCKAITGDGCPSSGTRIILAPIDEKGVPQLGAGIVLTEGYPLVVGLTGKQIK